MQLEEQERLKGAFNAVFDEKGQVKIVDEMPVQDLFNLGKNIRQRM